MGEQRILGRAIISTFIVNLNLLSVWPFKVTSGVGERERHSPKYFGSERRSPK